MTEQFTVKSDELEIAVEIFGNGPPLIFAHGLSGNRAFTKRQFQPLCEDFRIITFDQRGHGDSTPIKNPELYDAARMANDIAAILDALNITQAVVGGESMGSATALKFALQWPQRVKSLLLTAPAFGDKPNTETERLQFLSKLIFERGIKFCLATMPERMRTEQGASAEVIQTISDMWRSHDPESLATALATVATWVLFSDLDILKTLTMQVRIIAWDNDPLHSLALAQKLNDIFPDSVLKTIPSMLTLFERPQIVGETYRQMLNEAFSGSK